MGSRIQILFIPVIIFILGLSFTVIVYSYVPSPLGRFNVSAYENFSSNTTYLNWTNSFNSMFDVTTNTSFNNNLFVVVLNNSSSSALSENYSQGNSQTACQNLKLFVLNSTGNYNNTILVNGTFNVSFNTANCLPGRYTTNSLTVYNYSNISDSSNVSVTLDLPINNTLPSSGIGYFTGTIPTNYTTYQSYYFNTSLVPNATAVYLNLSGWTATNDIDAFLFDNSTPPVLIARSSNKSTNVEGIIYQYLPRNRFWEIRVFGNATSPITYNGNITYSTLNATFPNSGATINQLNYGVLAVNSVNNTNISIRNEGSINASDVAQTLEFYIIKRFVGNSSTNFTVLIPNSSMITRVKAVLNWTGQSNYTLNAYNSTNNLIGTSINQFVQANTSGAPGEEYNETTFIPTSAGVWSFEVKNNTNVAYDGYNLSVYSYVDSSQWFATNYSTYSFNGFSNSTDVKINLSVPNNSIDGIYEGNIYYLSSNGAGIKVPLSLNVSAPSLVLNGTTSNLVYRIDENPIPSGVLTRWFTFQLNNTGSYNLSLSILNSTNFSSGSTDFIANLTLNASTANSSDLVAGTAKAVNVSVSFNSSLPTGVYDGWIYFDGSNSNVSMSAHPADTFNLTLRLNLTTNLNVNVSGVTAANGTNFIFNSSINDNVRTKLSISYINGTPLPHDVAQLNLNASNVSIWFVEGNVSTRIPATGNSSVSNGTNPIYCTSGCGSLDTNFYYVNASVPATPVGGVYDVHVGVNVIQGSNSFYGEGVNRSLIVNSTGLFMTAMNSTSISISNDTNYMFAINVSNYGPIDASGVNVNFSESCNYTISSGPTYAGCPSTGSFTPTNFSSSCVVYWTIHSGSNSEPACTGNIIGAPAAKWHNPNGVNVAVTTTLSSGSTNTSSSNPGASTTNPTQNASLIFSKADSIIFVQQGQTNTSTVQVKNTGATVQIVSFNITTLNRSWYSVNNSNSTSLSSGAVRGYLVTFSPGNADWNDYSGNFVETGSASSATSPFTLRVLPNAQTTSNITSTFTQLNANFTELTNELNQSKNQGKNVTEAQQQLDLLKAKLDQANTYLSNGDYHSAYQLISDIQNLYSQTKDALSKATAPPSPLGGLENILNSGGGYLKYILIGAGVAVAAVLAYLFWPTKTNPNAYSGEVTKTVLAPKQTEKSKASKLQFLNKIKEFFSKLFKRQPKESYQGKI